MYWKGDEYTQSCKCLAIEERDKLVKATGILFEQTWVVMIRMI